MWVKKVKAIILNSLWGKDALIGYCQGLKQGGNDMMQLLRRGRGRSCS